MVLSFSQRSGRPSIIHLGTQLKVKQPHFNPEGIAARYRQPTTPTDLHLGRGYQAMVGWLPAWAMIWSAQPRPRI